MPRKSLILAVQNQVELIVIGQSFDEEGKPNLAGRRRRALPKRSKRKLKFRL